jgi:hypothetical protein
VTTLAAYGGNLVAGGWFTSAGTAAASEVAVWDGVSWSAFGGGLSAGVPLAIAEFGSSLYAGGTLDLADGNPVSFLARWDGTTWTDFGAGLITGGHSSVFPIEVPSTEYGGGLLVGGDFIAIALGVIDLPGGGPRCGALGWL